uniref:Restriction endonuclease n=1 Tax=Steinernema glaseri TaxID=37863 RepID=A0A1I7ZB12_9BILA
EFDVESADARFRQKIGRIVANLSNANKGEMQTRTEYIEHPIYPGFRIYAVFRGRGETIVWGPRETKKWAKEDWFSSGPCTLLIE